MWAGKCTSWVHLTAQSARSEGRGRPVIADGQRTLDVLPQRQNMSAPATYCAWQGESHFFVFRHSLA